ncbi:AMP-binding protein [Nocardia africana]|uniref:AMP-binding domain protein n=1 Tax=Nocardia africana TaxID=134964 RepID=A0A378WX12_9NOCA|nr:AMP-binding protein [Nocardia africana]MCC3312903.1 AMP-binding protein [Nocardia africana]SUA45758.1 AMP-binding domain protein [Nocardia africana]
MIEHAPHEGSAEQLLWPRYVEPADLTAVESVPLEARGLPESTYALLARAATRWPHRNALTVLPDATRWREPARRSYAELLAQVNRYANLLYSLGVRRGDAVAIIAPNSENLIAATLASQLAGLAAPINGGLARDHIAELLRRSAARILIVAGPELSADTWTSAYELAAQGLVDALLVLRPTAAHDLAPTLPFIDGVRVGYLDSLAADHDSATFVGELPKSSDLAALFHTGGTTGVQLLDVDASRTRHSFRVAQRRRRRQKARRQGMTASGRVIREPW